jgi:mono/diheme cytochrome c family protein
MKALVLTGALLAVATVCQAQSPSPSPDTIVARGQAAFKNQGCYGCHVIGKFGTPIGPDLSTVGRKYQPDYLARWLRDPALQRPSAHMPALELSETEIRDLAAYLGGLR